ncbi:MAG: hypothetical protein JSS66_06520 [Armatimonadetes bacterium]|nr:hypothetical protein [Armatimonadota bacterium]
MGKKELHTLNALTAEGDLELVWDPDNKADCDNAREVFQKFLEMGFEAYEVTEVGSRLDEAIGCVYGKSPVETIDVRLGRLMFNKHTVLAPGKVQGGFPTPGMNESRL